MNEFSDIVILCIGTGKLIGDLVGPITGQKLKRLFKNYEKIKVYGDINKSVNITNVDEIIEEISRKFNYPFIITVDSALGPKEVLKTVHMTIGKIKLGDALSRKKVYKSNINFKAIVGEDLKNDILNFNVLKSVERDVVQRLANEITFNIYKMCINMI